MLYASGSPTPFDFGSQTLNTESTPAVFTIKNTGKGVLNITSSLVISGTNQGEFAIKTPPGTSSIAAGDSTTFSVVFKPTDPASTVKTATLTIPNNDGDEGSYTIQLTGTVAETISITSFTPGEGIIGTEVIVNGSGFSNDMGVAFKNVNGEFVFSDLLIVESPTRVRVAVPYGAVTSTITVMNNLGQAESTTQFVVLTITSFSPAKGPVGTEVIINGSGFSNDMGVAFKDSAGAFVFSDLLIVESPTRVRAAVPYGAVTSTITVMNNLGQAVTETTFVVTPKITEFSPPYAPVGATVRIKGSNLNGTSTITFNGITATVKNIDQYTVETTVPAGATSGPVVLTNLEGSTQAMFYVSPNITSLSPNTGKRGDEITVKGQNLENISSVTVNGAVATYTNTDINTIVLTVPTGATIGDGFIVVKTTAAGSDSAAFTVLESTTLPVELVEFTGKSNAKGITLTWKTASEQDNAYFEVQASQNPAKEEFRTIQRVNSKVTNSSSVTSYEALDATAAKGVVTYYRLKQVDLNGTSEYTKTIAVKNIASTNTPILVKAYPNPFGENQNLNIRVEAENAGNMTVVLYYVTGKKAFEQVFSVESGVSYIELPLSITTLSKGMFILSTELNGETTTTRVVKQ
ncbi:hypothetical protein DC20_08730 [Rufibacter tibetensis]|uniref:IPT/TIG domain-containing protein n=1 Tax=Rufibacter tibetensis TaxID=512763 RepID=A0A0P0C6R9_9BACT|nr:hypothetical protein DC20_08730 [Rufibacter tibetensis]